MSREPFKLAELVNTSVDESKPIAASQLPPDILSDTGAAEKTSGPSRFRKIALAVVGISAVVVSLHEFVLPFAMKSGVPEKAANAPAAPPAAKAPATPDIAAFSKSVQELMRYAGDLKAGRITFNAAVTGEDAARQLGFTRLFASGYDEVVLRVKRRSGQGRPDIADVIAGFDLVVQQEQMIDQLLARNGPQATAISFLRALQNGDVTFPAPQELAPVPATLLAQLKSAYPEFAGNVDDPFFAAVYRQTRLFASDRMAAARELFAQEVIGEWRRLIVTSVTQPDAAEVTCARLAAIQEITALVKACPGLRLKSAAATAFGQVSTQAAPPACKDVSAGDFGTALGAMNESEKAQLCARTEARAREGTSEFLEVAR